MGSCFSSSTKHASAVPTASGVKQTAAAAATETKPVGVEIASVPEALPVRRREPASEVDQAVVTLKSSRDRANKELDLADQRCDELLKSALAYKEAGNDDRARLQMKRRRLVKQRAEDASFRIEETETMLQTIRTQKNAAEMLTAMQDSTAVLKKFSEIVNVETVAKTKEGLDAQRAEAAEVQRLFDQAAEDGLAMPTEEELQAELDAFYANGGEAPVEAKVEETTTSADSSTEAIEKINSAEPTPDVLPEMPSIEPEVVETKKAAKPAKVAALA